MHFYILHSVSFRSVYLHHSMLCSLLHVDQCIYAFLFFALCYMYISVSTSLYSFLCVTCTICTSVYLHHSILSYVLPVDHINTILFFTLCYMYISVSTPFYTLFCVTCRYVYLPVLYFSLLHVDLCIYTVLYYTLCGSCCGCYFIYHYCFRFDKGVDHVLVVIFSTITLYGLIAEWFILLLLYCLPLLF
jgi:hypothetical protein